MKEVWKMTEPKRIVLLNKFRVWPDGTAQWVGEPAYSWMSDDYEVVVANDEEDAVRKSASCGKPFDET
jgi:hypothetical protein